MGAIFAASTIRVRATMAGNTTEVQVLFKHPMDSGLIKDPSGNVIPPHFIQRVTFQLGDKTVFVADWGPGISKDPYLKFSFRGGNKDDDLKVSWVDNLGAHDSTIEKIQ